MIITSKLHPGVMGLSGHVPTLCIAYDQKQIGLFKLLGMEDCVISIMESSCETISSKIDSIWKNREEIRALLETRIPQLQKNIKKAIEEALSFYDLARKN